MRKPDGIKELLLDLSPSSETWLVVDPGKTCGFILWRIDSFRTARIIMAGVTPHTEAILLFEKLAPHRLIVETFPTSTRLSWEGQKPLLDRLLAMNAKVVQVPAAAWKSGRFDSRKLASDLNTILGDHLRDALGLSRFAFHQASQEVELCES